MAILRSVQKKRLIFYIYWPVLSSYIYIFLYRYIYLHCIYGLSCEWSVLTTPRSEVVLLFNIKSCLDHFHNFDNLAHFFFKIWRLLFLPSRKFFIYMETSPLPEKVWKCCSERIANDQWGFLSVLGFPWQGASVFSVIADDPCYSHLYCVKPLALELSLRSRFNYWRLSRPWL